MIAIAVIAAMIGGLIILVRPFVGLMAIIVLIPLAMVPALGSGLLGIFSSATPIKLIGGVTFVGALIQHMTRRGKWDFLKEPTVVFYNSFLVYVLINGFAMPSSFTRENFTFYTSIAIIGFIVITQINTFKKFRIFLWSFMAVYFVVCFQTFFNPAQFARFSGRLAGTANDPNYFAISLLPFIAISFYSVGAMKNKFLKFVSLFFSLVFLGAFALTQSRGGFVGLVAMVLIAFITAKKKFLALIVLIFSSVIILNLMPAEFWERFRNAKVEVTAEDEMNEALGSAIRRHYLALAARDMFFDHPLFGVGLGNYYWDCPLYYPVWPGRAHNMHLEILAEMGAVGYLLFLGIIFSFFKCLKRMNAAGPPYNLLAKAFFIGHVGFLISAIFLHAQQEKGFWIIMFLAVAMERIWRQEQENKSKPAQPAPIIIETEEEQPKPKKLKMWRM